MTRMKQDSHIYLLLQYYSLFAIPVRLYENKQLIFQKIPFIDTIPSNRSNFKDPEALDLLEKLLIVDHRERITAAEALNHSFFKLVRDFDYKRNNVESE